MELFAAAAVVAVVIVEAVQVRRCFVSATIQVSLDSCVYTLDERTKERKRYRIWRQSQIQQNGIQSSRQVNIK